MYDGDVDANSPSNGESLYRPTRNHHSPIFPHSPDHLSAAARDQSATHIGPYHTPIENPHQSRSNTGDRVSPSSDLFIIFDLSHARYKSFQQMINPFSHDPLSLCSTPVSLSSFI